MKRKWQDPEYRRRNLSGRHNFFHTEEAKERIRRGNLGKVVSKKTKAKLSKANTGKNIREKRKTNCG